ncbi:DUF7674 family protein [Thaumasiovibrio subtropicus]|uniref:DUF7674 family protein n=1 Tax=Thaumasiovibrio subtropicus TaxID=1891207 RepID=UPI000B363EDB|nr:hypothetical protein [Thaumasiovibrio subtropicus]
MTVLSMYKSFRTQFPKITKKADVEHIRLWGEVNPECAYSWFGSLANVLNYEMVVSSAENDYKSLFEFFRSSYLNGESEVRDCIDVSFVENLFFNVPVEKVAPFWDTFPDVLKQLYVRFHGRKPTY